MKKNWKNWLVFAGILVLVLMVLAGADDLDPNRDTEYVSNSVNAAFDETVDAEIIADENVVSDEDTVPTEKTEESDIPVENDEIVETPDEAIIPGDTDVIPGETEEIAEEELPSESGITGEEITEEQLHSDEGIAEEEIPAEAAFAEEEAYNEQHFRYTFDEKGNLILDEKGMPVLDVEDGYQIIASYDTDEEGNLILDEAGYPVMLDYVELKVRIKLIVLNEDGILTYGSDVRLQAIVDNAPEGVELHYAWYCSADWDTPLPADGDHYDFTVDRSNAWYEWQVDVWF